MTENKDKFKKKKTLSLKLDSKPVIPPRRNIEAGKTVIVEKKRVKRVNSIENKKTNIKAQPAVLSKSDEIVTKKDSTKSGVLLKPLSKDEQKKNT